MIVRCQTQQPQLRCQPVLTAKRRPNGCRRQASPEALTAIEGSTESRARLLYTRDGASGLNIISVHQRSKTALAAASIPERVLHFPATSRLSTRTRSSAELKCSGSLL